MLKPWVFTVGKGTWKASSLKSSLLQAQTLAKRVDVSYLLWTTLQVNGKEPGKSFLSTPSPTFPHSSWYPGGAFFAWSSECTCSFDLNDSHISTLCFFVLDTVKQSLFFFLPGFRCSLYGTISANVNEVEKGQDGHLPPLQYSCVLFYSFVTHLWRSAFVFELVMYVSISPTRLQGPGTLEVAAPLL